MERKKCELLTNSECAEKLNISRATLGKLMAKGAISYYRIGLKVMFSEEHLADYLKSVEKPLRPMDAQEEASHE